MEKLVSVMRKPATISRRGFLQSLGLMATTVLLSGPVEVAPPWFRSKVTDDHVPDEYYQELKRLMGLEPPNSVGWILHPEAAEKLFRDFNKPSSGTFSFICPSMAKWEPDPLPDLRCMVRAEAVLDKNIMVFR